MGNVQNEGEGHIYTPSLVCHYFNYLIAEYSGSNTCTFVDIALLLLLLVYKQK